MPAPTLARQHTTVYGLNLPIGPDNQGTVFVSIEVLGNLFYALGGRLGITRVLPDVGLALVGAGYAQFHNGSAVVFGTDKLDVEYPRLHEAMVAATRTPARDQAIAAIIESVEVHGRAATAALGAELAVDIVMPLLLSEAAHEVGRLTATERSFIDAVSALQQENLALTRHLLDAEAVISAATGYAQHLPGSMVDLVDVLSGGELGVLENVIADEVERRIAARIS
jgi:hypothetical protein